MAENGYFNISSHGQTNFQIGEKSKIRIGHQETCVNAENVAGLERRIRMLESQLDDLKSAVEKYQPIYVSKTESENETESFITIGTNAAHDDGYEDVTNNAYDDEYYDENYDECYNETQIKQPITQNLDETQVKQPIVQNMDVTQPIVDSRYDVVKSGMTPRGTANAQYDYRQPPSNWYAAILTLLTEIKVRLPNIPIYQLSSSNKHNQISMREYENLEPHYDSVGFETISAVRLSDDGYDPLEETDTTLAGDRPNPNSQITADITSISSRHRSISSLTANQRRSVHESPDNASLTNEFQVSTEDLLVSLDDWGSGRGSTTNGITRNGDLKIIIKHTNGLRSARRREWISVGPTTTIHDIKRRFLDCFGCRAYVDYIVTPTQMISQTIFDDCSTLGCMGIDGGSVVHCVSY